jgi:pimeloyl-ACP methyl ester carboxylesterase
MGTKPDRMVGVNGVEIAVDDRGAGGVPLVLVHGFTGSRLDFADVIDELATDRRVVAWDHRGHADSTNTADRASYTFDQLVADMAAVIDELDLARFDLLGHSMGGIVSMQYALAHLERVRSLILMDTLATPDVIPPELFQLMIDNARQKGMDGVCEEMLEFETTQQRVPAANHEAVLERTRYKLTNMDLDAFTALGEALMAFPPLLERLRSEIHCPTTVLVGENDTGLLGAAADMATAIDGAVEVVIEDAAHSPQEENPPAWLAAVRAHLIRADA